VAAGHGFETYSIGYSVGLDGPGIKSRWWARFSAAVQTSFGVHPSFHTMGTWSLPGVKQPGRGFNDPNVSEERADFFFARNTDRQAYSFDMLLLIYQTLRRHGPKSRNFFLEKLIPNE